jgi:hypothetical protein
MNAVKELQKLDKRLAEARHDLRAIDEEQRSALADVKTAEAALADHFAQEHIDELHPTDLHNNLAAARNRAEQPWAQRREGKQRLVRRLEAERDRFVNDHLGELAASREDDAYAACDALIAAFEALEVAERGYADVEQWYTHLLRPCSVSTVGSYRASTSLPSSLAVQRVRERGIEAPLPRSLYGGENADPTIRSAA